MKYKILILYKLVKLQDIHNKYSFYFVLYYGYKLYCYISLYT